MWLAHAAATLALTGLIWTVQIVIYPQLGDVGRESFAAFVPIHAAYTARITLVVGPLMVVEALTGLAVALQPGPVPAPLAWIGFGLVAVAWLVTALVSVPLHEVLARGFEPGAHAQLVATNWIRTVAWTARAGLVLYVLARVRP